jgi:hypothetical protein
MDLLPSLCAIDSTYVYHRTTGSAMSTRAVVPPRDWLRRPTPRSKWRSTPTKTTSSRLSWRQVVASTKQPETGLMI